MGLKDRSTLASERGGSWENTGVGQERSRVAYWPIATIAALQFFGRYGGIADIGMR